MCIILFIFIKEIMYEELRKVCIENEEGQQYRLIKENDKKRPIKRTRV